MKISSVNNNLRSQNIFFGDAPKRTPEENAKLYKEMLEKAKTETNVDKLKEIRKILKEIQDVAKEHIGPIKIPGIFTRLFKYMGKIDKTGNKALDSAAMLTRIVLWGNVGKEAVGTTMYTVQALTNEDLPPDKRKFVGMYDLVVGLVSTTFSFIFGVGLEDKIKSGYKSMLDPLSKSPSKATRGKAAAAIVGLAAFSSFALQTIVGKRIVAPAVGTPMAGKLKKYMETKAAEKNNEEKKPEDDNMSPFPAEALILAKTDKAAFSKFNKEA